MPIYAYRCSACGHAKDVLQKISDPVLNVCPACGADSFRKQVTAAGFQLKGSGWYVTDFKGGANVAKPADAAAAPTPDAAKPADGAAAPAAAPAPASTGGGDSSGGSSSSGGSTPISAAGCGSGCACH